MKTGIAGFDRITGGLPEKGIIMVEEEPGFLKSIFLQRIAFEAAKEKKVVYASTHESAEDIISSMKLYGMDGSVLRILSPYRHNLNGSLPDDLTGEVCIIDTFSHLLINKKPQDIFSLLDNIKFNSRKLFLLGIDTGLLEAQLEIALRSYADGVIRLETCDTGDRINMSIRILKFRGIHPPNKKISVSVMENGMVVDTRDRVG